MTNDSVHLNREIQASIVGQAPRVSLWDGWRGLAVFLVLCGHFLPLQWWREDRLGVDIFFVLSGMLMSMLLFEKRIALKDFYVRRFSRIYPVLLLYVTGVTLFSLLFAINFQWSEVLASVLFVRTYFPTEPGIWHGELAIGHLWSLNVEEHGYLLLGLLTLLLRNQKAIGALLVLIACCCIAYSLNNVLQLPIDQFRLYAIRTESAVAFIFLSAGYRLLRPAALGQKLLGSLLPMCLLLVALCYTEFAPVWASVVVSPLLLGFCVNHLDSLRGLSRKLLESKVLKLLGLWSYSIYLWQQIYYEYAYYIPGGSFTALPLAVLTGVVSYYCFEDPVRHWINRRWSANPQYGNSSVNNRVVPMSTAGS